MQSIGEAMIVSSRPAHRRIRLIALLASALSLLVADIAGAATVSATDRLITFTAAPGETNDVSIRAGYNWGVQFTDAGAELKHGPGCVKKEEGIFCPEPDEADEIGPVGINISLGNRSDKLWLDEVTVENRQVTIWGSSGSDDMEIGSSVGLLLTVYGGHHDDRISTWLNASGFSRLYGGDGRDRLAVNEAGSAFLHGGPNHDELIYNSYRTDVDTPTNDMEIHGDGGRDTIRPADGSFDPRTVFAGGGLDTLSFSAVFRDDPDDPFVFDMATCAPCDIERVIGTPGDDIIYGDEDANTIWSGGGNDTIDPRGGHDYVYSGAGDDTVTSIDGDWDYVGCGEGLLDTVFSDRRDSVGGCEVVHRQTG
jgi:Ca2+-binding RTX toxin-like protein